MKKFAEVENSVLDILIRFPEARSNDYILFALYIQQKTPQLKDAGLIYALMEAKRIGLPNFESVTRCRRKLQERIPELRAPKNKSTARQAQEQAYRLYAKGAK